MTKENKTWRDELKKIVETDNNSISLFPYGGDSYDFDIENAIKFIQEKIDQARAEERGKCDDSDYVNLWK